MSRLANLSLIAACFSLGTPAIAETTVFFDSSQVATLVTSGVTSDTIISNGYIFTYTRDKLFTGGTGQIIGRSERVPWPDGIEAQAVTTPPPGVTDHKARLTIRKANGHVFDLTALTFKILANTAGAGASLEIMPLINGEDAFADPLYFEASGYYMQTFSYDETPYVWGSTALLKGYDTYKVSLYVDYAFVGLTLVSADVPGDFDGDGDVDLVDYSVFAACLAGPGNPAPATCTADEFAIADLDSDLDVDLA
ncbi:MAG TPA: hypothetical protein P5572_19130, partial [Phycisphaerae bacterium]|nr:hypothetical protein [Phycisphaerae bacterium]